MRSSAGYYSTISTRNIKRASVSQTKSERPWRRRHAWDAACWAANDVPHGGHVTLSTCGLCACVCVSAHSGNLVVDSGHLVGGPVAHMRSAGRCAPNFVAEKMGVQGASPRRPGGRRRHIGHRGWDGGAQARQRDDRRRAQFPSWRSAGPRWTRLQCDGLRLIRGPLHRRCRAWVPAWAGQVARWCLSMQS